MAPSANPQPGDLGPANFGPIRKTGGKVLMYIGGADQNIAPQNHLDFTDGSSLVGLRRPPLNIAVHGQEQIL